jgi:hypothetical protein
MTKLIAIYGLLGRKHTTGLLCYLAKWLSAKHVLILGDVGSPSVIERLISCELRVYGVLGRYDDPSVATTLSRNGGLLECRRVVLDEAILYGYGMSGCITQLQFKGDIGNVVLVSSMVGYRYNCCCRGIKGPLDIIVELIKPNYIVTGGCIEPCFDNKVYSPGSLIKGYVGVIELDHGIFSAKSLNIYRDFLLRF